MKPTDRDMQRLWEQVMEFGYSGVVGMLAEMAEREAEDHPYRAADLKQVARTLQRTSTALAAQDGE